MSDDAKKSVEEKINELSNNFDDSEFDSSQDETDEMTDDSSADSTTDDSDDKSDDSETNEDDATDSTTDDEAEPDFSFKDTPTNIQNFVSKLEKMSESERRDKIESLDPKRNAKEIVAAKEKFPGLFQDRFELSKKEWDDLQEKLKQLETLTNAEETKKLLETLNAKKPDIESELETRMLRDKYGNKADDVLKDSKFRDALNKYKKLDIADRLEAASMMSPVARKILIEQEAAQQNKQKASQKRKSGSHISHKTEYKHSILTDEGIMERFGDRL